MVEDLVSTGSTPTVAQLNHQFLLAAALRGGPLPAAPAGPRLPTKEDILRRIEGGLPLTLAARGVDSPRSDPPSVVQETTPTPEKYDGSAKDNVIPTTLILKRNP